MNTRSQTETTGITDADAFVTAARELGLNAEFRGVKSDVAYYSDGGVMLPEILCVTVIVSIPVPGELDGTYLGMTERHTRLTGSWTLKDTPRSRGRWTLSNYSYLGGHEDLHVKHRMYTRLQVMADRLTSLQRLVQG
jgi:hypothetical protein